MKDPIQAEIEAKGLTAPRVTPADIQAEIVGCFFFTAKDAVKVTEPDDFRYFSAEPQLKLLTFCVLVLANGFTVTGESACASPENFDAELGQKIARQKAEEKIWTLLGFRLRDKLAAGAAVDGAGASRQLPVGITMNDHGALLFDGEPTAAFAVAGLRYARTQQQIGNICTQCGCNPDGTLQPAGPGITGWDTGQVWNRMQLPLLDQAGFDAHGSPRWVAADGIKDGPDKWAYQRIRVRATSLTEVRAAIADSKVPGPRV